MPPACGFVSFSVMSSDRPAQKPGSPSWGPAALAPDDRLHVRLLQAGNRLIDHAWNSADVRSSFWRLYVNERDGAELILDQHAWPIPPRQPVIVPAWVHFSCRNRRTLRHRFVHFDLIGWPSVVVRELFPGPVTLPPAGPAPHNESSNPPRHAEGSAPTQEPEQPDRSSEGDQRERQAERERNPKRSAGSRPSSDRLHGVESAAWRASNASGDVVLETVREALDKPGALDMPARCRLKAAVFLALSRAVERLADPDRRRAEQAMRAHEPVAAAFNYVERHMAEKIRNRDLARACHMSEDHFIRVFRETVGQTPGQFVRERRIVYAAQELVFTDDSIEAIAERAGFANRYHFSRAFGRLMNVPPAAYRARISRAT